MESFDHHQTNTSAALEAGQVLAIKDQKPQTLEDGLPFIISAEGKPVSLEKFLPYPARHKARPKLLDAASFIAYVNLYKTQGTLIFSKFSLTGGAFTALLDIAPPGRTSWNDHSATFLLSTTADWATWMSLNNKWMSQEDFCLFVDQQRLVFSEPDSATMKEIAMNIEATMGGTFKSGFRAQSGSRTLVIDMSTVATSKVGEKKVEIPEEITVILTPFEGQNPVLVSAFLRFRPSNEGVRFQFELQRPDEIVKRSVEEARARIASETTLLVLNGEMPANAQE